MIEDLIAKNSTDMSLFNRESHLTSLDTFFRNHIGNIPNILGEFSIENEKLISYIVI